jgi:branched-chain amino acid transport system substrate-binding protein
VCLTAAVAAVVWVGGAAGAGGTKQKADSKLDPVTIGVITVKDDAVAQGLASAERYANAELGGVDKHPLKVKTCIYDGSPESAQKCAQDFVNDDSIDVVSFGLVVVGDSPIFPVLEGKKPIVGGLPASQTAFFAKDAYFYLPGSPGVISGMAVYTRDYVKGAKKVVAIGVDTPEAKQAFDFLLKPILTKAGIDYAYQGYPPQGTTDLTSTVAAAQSQDPDVIMVITDEPGCVQSAKALAQLQVKAKVVTTGVCTAPHAVKAAGASALKGWDAISFDSNGTTPKSKLEAKKLLQYAPKKKDLAAFSGPVWADTIALVEIMQEIGFDKLSPETIRAAAKAYTGPLPLLGTSQQCGQVPLFASVCTFQVRASTFNGKKNVPAADNKVIDPSSDLAAD